MTRLLVLTAPLLLLGCDNECSFQERCDGTTLEVCGDGPDQVVGRKVNTTDCTAEAVDGTCVEIDDQSATCASEPVTECDLEQTDSVCEGDVLVGCTGVYYTTPVSYPTGFVVRVDCAAEGATCVEADGLASCEAAEE